MSVITLKQKIACRFRQIIRYFRVKKSRLLIVCAGFAIVALSTAIAMYFVGLLWHSNSTQQDLYYAIPAHLLKGLEKSKTSGCVELYKVTVPEHTKTNDLDALCSHGPDVVQSIANDSPEVAYAESTSCYGDGVSGKRVQAIYAVSKDVPDKYAQTVGEIRKWAGYVEAKINQSAQKTGSPLHVKWVSKSDCVLDVAKVVMPPEGDDGFGQTIAAVREAGFDNPTRVYLIWTDATMYCGMATMRNDDSADPILNRNNFGLSYSRVDRPCWGLTNSVELHELAHNLGAVQDSAPNSTGYGHCRDGYDVMCYKDSPATTLKYVCTASHEVLLDCNNDDYLNSKPAEGSYLATHWNLYNSDFLYHKEEADKEAPSTPTNLSASVKGQSVLLQWAASIDNTTKEVKYHIYRRVALGETTRYKTVSAVTYTDVYVEPSVLYQYYVVAIDEAGNASGNSNTVSARPASPVDVTPPAAPSSLVASAITTSDMRLTWIFAADTADVSRVAVVVNGKEVIALSGAATSYHLCCSLVPNTNYTVQVRAFDKVGNSASSNQIVAKTLATVVTPSNGHKPYDLKLLSASGSEATITARIDTTADGAYVHELVYAPSTYGMDTYLPSSTTPTTYTFRARQFKPQNVTGFYIVVRDSARREIARSETLNFTFTGVAESNPPSVPSGFGFSQRSPVNQSYVMWSPSSDDSGTVYRYHHRIVNNTTGEVYSTTPGYSTSLLLYSHTGAVPTESYTVYVKAEDIWGNYSAEGSYLVPYP